jgi:hypothetical protein
MWSPADIGGDAGLMIGDEFFEAIEWEKSGAMVRISAVRRSDGTEYEVVAEGQGAKP